MAIALSLLLAALWTVAIELAVCLITGYRTRHVLASVVCINLLTNPLLNYLLVINHYFSLIPAELPLILSLELLVVFVEWRLLVYALPGKPGTPVALHQPAPKADRAYLGLSFFMNFCSYMTGFLGYP